MSVCCKLFAVERRWSCCLVAAFRVMSASKKYKYVVAIDFGTSGTGFAFAPTSIVNPPVKTEPWPGGAAWKTPTDALFEVVRGSNELKFVSFGQVAFNEYQEKNRDAESQAQYCFFEHFKMSLYGEDVTQEQHCVVSFDRCVCALNQTSTQMCSVWFAGVQDAMRKSHRALPVFAASIKDASKTILERLQVRSVLCGLRLVLSWCLVVCLRVC